jgi:hypothetical protein
MLRFSCSGTSYIGSPKKGVGLKLLHYGFRTFEFQITECLIPSCICSMSGSREELR